MSEAVLFALVVAAFVATAVVLVLRRRHTSRQTPPDPRHRRGAAASSPTDVESGEPAAPAVEADTLFDAAATSPGWTEPDTLPGSPPPGAKTSTEPDTLPGSPPPGAKTSTEPEGAPPTRRTARSGPQQGPAEVATEPTGHQCPHCGHDDIVLDLDASAWTCGRCARQWSDPRGEPWPDVVLCLWLPANAPSQET